MAGIELDTVRRFVDVAVDALAAAREEIDALNVYPVPDGDTGTNMYLTVASARDALGATEPTATDRSAGLEAFARGALLGARGNSGVILSEMLGAVARRLRDADDSERNAVVMADGLRRASDASYAAVGEPVEGTMLSVLRAASEAAQRVVSDDDRARARDVFTAATAAARDALARTPEQLEVLRNAGVVDAGGRGLCVILDAAETALTGKRPVVEPAAIGAHAIPVPQATGADLSADGPAYEVMYLLEAEDDDVPDLRVRLGGLGDSVVVVGGDGTWHVHVHTDDVGAVIETGLAAGRPHRIRVTHFAEQAEADRREPVAQRRVVAVAAGPGLAAIFREAGAVVVEGRPGVRPSTGELLEAITECRAREIIVLPNDENSVRAARMAASTAELDDTDARGIRVSVIPTRAQVQGLAALAVHEPGRAFDQDVTEMTATARHVRDGAVTLAARTAMTSAGPCEEGDALGVVSGDFVIVGNELAEVTRGVLTRLLAPGGELVTLASGVDGADLADTTAAWVEAEYPHVDVVVYDGGQERYPLLMSVE
ncbi:DAK2 domain-containing protein [Nocardioides panacisoli]|uniref:DAK2 domain-containing protein n=1 Tax=Nocardioides panacisoli TaxID=627624 RepID=UPI001C631E9A|nr:DAK2 domain-containing protein [Nocardioides panacisoli]QYJ04553.1 DAK2 domain-containing protein [Nocardioides panacisoli]